MIQEKVHIGKNIVRIRELRGIKQEHLAAELGVTQQAVSKMEQSESIDDVKLEIIAKALGVTVDAIKSFNEDAVVFHIQSMNDQSSANYQYYNNPIEKVIELYERLLQSERDKNEILTKNLEAATKK